jgi:ABC-type Fe3+-hydroxamate transport system substrate-binding protein
VRANPLIALALLCALAGCQESGFDESKETSRPLKVQHAMDPLTGTRVPGTAERPYTLTCDTLGDALALGVTPVGAFLGGGRLPEYLTRAADGVEVSRDLGLGDIEATEPDVILGAKELQESDYDELKKIAPTIMSEGDDWKLNLRLHGEALGRTNDAEALLTDWDNRVARVKRKIGDRKVSIVLTAKPPVREFSLEPGSIAGSVLGDLGLRQGGGGEVVLHVDGGLEWAGGGVLAARAALADVDRAL